MAIKIKCTVIPAVTATAIPLKGTFDMFNANLEITVAIPIKKEPTSANDRSESFMWCFGLNQESKKTPNMIDKVPKPINEFICSFKRKIAKIIPKSGAVAINEAVRETPTRLKLSKLVKAAKPGAKIPDKMKNGIASGEGNGLFVRKTKAHMTTAAVPNEISVFERKGFLCMPILIIVAFKPKKTADKIANSIGSICI